MNTNPNLSNKLTVKQLEEEFGKLGSAEGFGRDSQVKFHLRLVEAAHQQAIDTTKNKHGDGRDDATVLVEAYYNARQGNNGTQWDAKAPNIRKARSIAKKCIELGMWDKSGNPSEPWETVQHLMNARRSLQKQHTENLDDACNTLLRFARAQLKQDTVLPKDRLHSFCYKAARQINREAEAYVESICKTAIGLKEGSLKGGAQSDAKEIVDIIVAAKNWLAYNATGKTRAKPEAGDISSLMAAVEQVAKA